jgi:hypothetical protein
MHPEPEAKYPFSAMQLLQDSYPAGAASVQAKQREAF